MTINIEERETLSTLILTITKSGDLYLDPTQVKQVKKICKKSDTNVRIAYELLMIQLQRKHAQIRFSSTQLIAELFQRSHVFRELLVADYSIFLQLTVGIHQNPLPPPVLFANKTKQLAISLTNEWNAKYGSVYKQIFERIAEYPFNSDQKFMHVKCAPLPGGSLSGHKQTPEHAIDPTNAAVSQSGLPGIFYFKGALEPVLERCVNYYRSESQHLPLDVESKDKISAQANEMASHGLRVLAMAFGSDLEKLTFVGIVAMHDPPRPGVEDSIRTLAGSGVKVIMITGDADATALSIARRLGFPINPGKSSCLTGAEIEVMTERQLQDAVGHVSVFARTTPKHKMAIVSAFQAKGCIVAMTGDGVNDAPALKLADIGISMGRSGTDVAKEAADMILVDDDFSTILAAVEEGKSIFYNIQNFLTFQLSTSVAALTLIATATLFGLNNPLNAMQILWISGAARHQPEGADAHPERQMWLALADTTLSLRLVVTLRCYYNI
ncbi:High affinity Ca2+/Mn2+ P-type ATPase-like protein [Lobosporangium transversale]|nr:High affinity Ca2+/Mn2+ P-type ATPase-like protein [Lobosporangium transversale]